MLEGTAFIAIVTAAIASTVVARASRDLEAERERNELPVSPDIRPTRSPRYR
jgi:hypothetical protein